jgi:hypothetical protein
MRLPRSCRLFRCRTVARDCGKPLRDTLLGSSKGRDYRIESRSRQRFTAIGRAYSHRIPLVQLKCIRSKRWEELAARRRGRSRAAVGA